MSTAEAKGRGIAWLVLLGIAGYIWFTFQSDSRDRAAKLAKSNSPAEIVALLTGKEPSKVSVEHIGGLMRVAIKIDSYIEGAAAGHAIKLVPQIFERFPDVQEIELRGRADFQDRRGNRSEQDAVRIVFSRSNAKTINWPNMLRADLPHIADRYWLHPGARQ
jgi:hypothetical protein